MTTALRRHHLSWTVALVVVVHVLGALLLASAKVWPDRGVQRQPAVVWLRLLPEQPARAQQAQAASPRPEPGAAALPFGRPQQREPAALQWLPTSQSIGPVSGPTTATESAIAAASAPAQTASTPLRLDLPRAVLTERRNPAPADERFRAERSTLETRIRDATGGVGDALIEERLADGTLKLRRGTDCLLVRPSRAATLDPFNDAVSKKARGVESCR